MVRYQRRRNGRRGGHVPASQPQRLQIIPMKYHTQCSLDLRHGPINTKAIAGAQNSEVMVLAYERLKLNTIGRCFCSAN